MCCEELFHDLRDPYYGSIPTKVEIHVSDGADGRWFGVYADAWRRLATPFVRFRAKDETYRAFMRFLNTFGTKQAAFMVVRTIPYSRDAKKVARKVMVNAGPDDIAIKESGALVQGRMLVAALKLLHHDVSALDRITRIAKTQKEFLMLTRLARRQ